MLNAVGLQTLRIVYSVLALKNAVNFSVLGQRIIVLWVKLRTATIQWKALAFKRESSKKFIITVWSEKVSNNNKRAYQNMYALSDMSVLSL